MLITSRLQAHCKQSLVRLAELKGQWALFFMWPLLGVLAITALWQFEVAQASREQDNVRSEALVNADRLARSYAHRLDSALEKIDALTAYIEHDWSLYGNNVRLENLGKQDVFRVDRLHKLFIIGPNGRLQTSTVPMPINADFSDQPYFVHHKQVADRALSISAPTAETPLQRQDVNVTRRLNGPDGSFAGVIVTIMKRDLFEAMSDNPTFGRRGFKALLQNDYVAHFAMIDTKLMSRAQLMAINSQPCRVGVTPVRLDSICFADRQARYVAVSSLTHYPFKTLIGLSEQEVMQPFRTHLRAEDDLITAASLLIIFFCLFAWLLTMNMYLKRKSESHIRMAYLVATENGRHGFFLWKRVRNHFGRVVDFRIVDCNEFGARMYHQSRDELIGKTITDLYGVTPYRDIVIASGIQMDFDGEGESEYAVRPESTMTAKWLFFRYARTYEGIAVTLRDISEDVLNRDEITRRATHDALTDLPNRYWLKKSLPIMLQRAAHNGKKLAVLFIDLDNFKRVNDTLGHAAGDVLLRAAADRLQSLMRPGDRVARLGGDEFIIILDGVADDADIGGVAERIVSAFKVPFVVDATDAHVGASIGMAQFPRDGNDADKLLERADAAMYRAKMKRCGYSFFQDAPCSEAATTEKENATG